MENSYNWDYLVSLGIEAFAWDEISKPYQDEPYEQMEQKTLADIEAMTNVEIDQFIGLSIRKGKLSVQGNDA